MLPQVLKLTLLTTLVACSHQTDPSQIEDQEPVAPWSQLDQNSWLQRSTGLVWTIHDYPVNRIGSIRICNVIGGIDGYPWRLPRREELRQAQAAGIGALLKLQGRRYAHMMSFWTQPHPEGAGTTATTNTNHVFCVRQLDHG